MQYIFTYLNKYSIPQQVNLLPFGDCTRKVSFQWGEQVSFVLEFFFTNKPTLIDIILYLLSAFFKILKCFTDTVSN